MLRNIALHFDEWWWQHRHSSVSQFFRRKKMRPLCRLIRRLMRIDKHSQDAIVNQVVEEMFQLRQLLILASQIGNTTSCIKALMLRGHDVVCGISVRYEIGYISVTVTSDSLLLNQAVISKLDDRARASNIHINSNRIFVYTQNLGLCDVLSQHCPPPYSYAFVRLTPEEQNSLGGMCIP